MYKLKRREPEMEDPPTTFGASLNIEFLKVQFWVTYYLICFFIRYVLHD